MTDPDPSALPPTTSHPSPKRRLSRALRLEVVAASLVVSSLAVGMLHRVWTRRVTELEARVKLEERRGQELQEIKSELELHRHLIEDYQRRVATIKTLQNSQVGPSGLMEALAKAVAMSGGISLRTIALQRSRVILSGQARSPGSMTSFSTYLQRSGNFVDVQLRGFYQQEDRTPPTYKFNLDCAPPPRR